MSTPILSADQLCRALEQVLVDHLPSTMTAHGLTVAAGYKPVTTWQQVPTIAALSQARYPAGAITSTGLVRAPKWIASKQAHEAVWRLVVGVYARGRDHDTTAALVRDYAAAVRTTVLTRKSLGGLANALEWQGEEFALLPGRESARTIGAGAVAFDVTALMTLDPTGPTTPLPVVTQTPTSLSVQ